jgi:hypothetical protein
MVNASWRDSRPRGAQRRTRTDLTTSCQLHQARVAHQCEKTEICILLFCTNNSSSIRLFVVVDSDHETLVRGAISAPDEMAASCAERERATGTSGAISESSSLSASGAISESSSLSASGANSESSSLSASGALATSGGTSSASTTCAMFQPMPSFSAIRAPKFRREMFRRAEVSPRCHNCCSVEVH